MSALSLEDAACEVVRGGGLGLADCGGGFEGDAEVDRGAVGNAALDTAGVVGSCCEAFGGGFAGGTGGRGRAGLDLRSDKGVIMNGAGDFAAAEARADFEALSSGDAEHGVGELSLELIEARLAQADGDIADDTGDGAADAVVGIAVLFDEVGDARGGLLAGAAGRSERVDGLAVDAGDEV